MLKNSNRNLWLMMVWLLIIPYCQAQKAAIETTTIIDSSEVAFERIQQMEMQFSEQLKADPSNIKLREKRASASLVLKKYSTAIKDYDYLIEQDEDNAYYYYRRGFNKLGNKQLEDACVDFKKARDLGYDFSDVQLNWAICE